MHQYNVHDAKTHLSSILKRVEAGEEVLIARAGRPIARLVPMNVLASPRTLGRYAGQPFLIADDFDAPLDGFEGGGSSSTATSTFGR